MYLETQNSMYFDRLYNRYATKVYSRCISLLKEPNLAQDAAQEIFIKIFMNLSKFSEKSKFSTWVYSISYNYCIDMIRRNKKNRAIFSDEMERAPDIVEEVPDEELLQIKVQQLKKVLNDIPVGDKAVLLMKYQDDMQIKEIASVLGKTESAIKMKIKRAKHKATTVYKEKYQDALEY